MENIITENDGKLQVQSLSAGNVASTADFDIEMTAFKAALQQFLESDRDFLAFELPARQLELSASSTGVQITQWDARRPQRMNAIIKWRDLARFLVA